MSLLDRIGRFIDDVLLLPDELRLRLDRAEDALEAKDFTLAARLFGQVAEARPSLARAHVGLAQALDAIGHIDDAHRAVREARKLEPTDGHVALLAAEIALKALDAEAAAIDARDAASRFTREQGPLFAKACALRARAEIRRGRPDRAARELRKALATTPNDPALRVELTEALLAAGQPALARASASGLDPQTVGDADAVRLGLALVEAGAGVTAGPWLERGAEAGSDAALIALAKMALDDGDLALAEMRARRAVARGGGATALGMLAAISLARGDAAEASDAFAAAASFAGGDVTLLRLAARAAPLGSALRLVQHADALERVSANDPDALAARAWAAISRDALDEARVLLERAPSAVEPPRIPLAHAYLRLREGAPKLALDALDRHADAVLKLGDPPVHAVAAAHPFADRETTESIRKDALRELWRTSQGDVDLAAAIDAVARFAREHGLVEVERRATKLRDELDRPLLLAVLGEFNAGKSTFINAFVGAEVAPTGILPTTATLNVLRGGAERLVRVIRRDGTTTQGAYEDVRAILKEAQTQPVDQVEIVLPSETLERVWILDTPGSNALDPVHAELAKEAAHRADAALWVFDATQAGKASEGEKLAGLHASHRLVIPILNKIDRLSPEERERVERVLIESLPALEVAPIGFSARQAVQARLAGDAAGLDASGYTDLFARLEAEVFSRSRELKRAACASRLLETLDTALAIESEATRELEQRAAQLAGSEKPLLETGRTLTLSVDDIIGSLEGAQQQAFREAADEVLAFARPLRSRFESGGADQEDRAFVAEIIERRLTVAIQSCRAALEERATRVLLPATRALDLDEPLLSARVRAALAAPFADILGYQRGLLAGGALRRFFDESRGNAPMESDAVVRALTIARADPRERLRPALVDALAALVSELETQRAAMLAEARRERASLVSRVYDPLRALRDVLAEVSVARRR